MALTFMSPLHKATRQLSVYMECNMADLVVSPQEGHVLSFLRSYAPCPVAELVRVFGLKQSTLTSMLDRLEEGQFILREVNPDDRRSFLVKLTPAGRAVANRIQRIVEALEEQLRAEVTREQLRSFQAVMAAIDRVTQVTLRDGRKA